MKLKLNENIGFYVWLWHSVNLFPLFETYSVSGIDADDVVARVFAITLFGVHFNLMVPCKKLHNMYTSPVICPLYSRRRKIWYWPDKV